MRQRRIPSPSAPPERLQLSLAYFLYFVTFGLFIPYFPTYLRARGLDEVAIGWVLALGPLLRIIVPPLLGVVADQRRGPRFWGVVAAWGSLGGMLCVWWSDRLALLVAGSFLYSLFTAPTLTLLDATTVRHDTGASRYGQIRVWGSVGYIVTSFGLGYFYPQLPQQVIILALVGSHTVFALFLLATRAEVAGAALPTGETVGGRLPLLLRSRAVWLLVLTLFFNRVASSPFNGFYTIFVGDLGLGGEVVALTWGIAVTTEVFVLLIVDRLIDRFGTSTVLGAGVGLEAVRWLAYAFIDEKWVLLAIAPAHGTAFAMLYVASVRAVAEIAPPRFRALGQGLSAAAAACGQTVGFVLAGYLYKNAGSRVMFTAAGLVGLVATACALLCRTNSAGSVVGTPAKPETP